MQRIYYMHNVVYLNIGLINNNKFTTKPGFLQQKHTVVQQFVLLDMSHKLEFEQQKLSVLTA